MTLRRDKSCTDAQGDGQHRLVTKERDHHQTQAEGCRSSREQLILIIIKIAPVMLHSRDLQGHLENIACNFNIGVRARDMRSAVPLREKCRV